MRNSYFLLADAVQGTTAHTYTWQLHGYGLRGGTAAAGTYADTLTGQQATWRKNGTTLLAHVTATGGTATYATASNIHETTYNTAESHTTPLVQQAGVVQTQFLAALWPYATTRPQVATTSQATTAALSITSAGFVDIAFAQADTVLTADASGRLPQLVSADGLLNLYSAAAGEFTQLFMQEGTRLVVGSVPLLLSSRRATLSLQRAAAGYDGYAGRATTLTLALGMPPAAVTGPGVASYAYNADAQRLTVVLSEASAFQIVPRGAPLPVVLTTFTATREKQGVLLTWRTASEQQSLGFEVQRQTAAAGAFVPLGFVASTDNGIAPASYRFPDAAAPAGTVYYRLRQLDRNGAAVYSPVVAVRAAEGPAVVLPAYPQPVRSTLHVPVAGQSEGVVLRLFDGMGREVARQFGQPLAELEVSQLAPGLYFLMGHDASGWPLRGQQKIVVER